MLVILPNYNYKSLFNKLENYFQNREKINLSFNYSVLSFYVPIFKFDS